MNAGKQKSFDERLREVLARYHESQEAYEQWLRERGLDPDAVREAARGPGADGAPHLAEMFERLRGEADRELSRAAEEEGAMEEAAVIDLPPWAIKA